MSKSIENVEIWNFEKSFGITRKFHKRVYNPVFICRRPKKMSTSRILDDFLSFFVFFFTLYRKNIVQFSVGLCVFWIKKKCQKHKKNMKIE